MLGFHALTGKKTGDVTDLPLDVFARMVTTGKFIASTEVQTAGLSDWTPLGEAALKLGWVSPVKDAEVEAEAEEAAAFLLSSNSHSNATASSSSSAGGGDDHFAEPCSATPGGGPDAAAETAAPKGVDTIDRKLSHLFTFFRVKIYVLRKGADQVRLVRTVCCLS